MPCSTHGCTAVHRRAIRAGERPLEQSRPRKSQDQVPHSKAVDPCYQGARDKDSDMGRGRRAPRVMRFGQALALAGVLLAMPAVAQEQPKELKPDVDLYALMTGKCSTLKVAGRDFG